MLRRLPGTLRVILMTALMIGSTGVIAMGAQSPSGGFSEAPIEEIPEYAPADAGQKYSQHSARPERARPIDNSTTSLEAITPEGYSNCQSDRATSGVSCLCAGPGICSGCPRCTIPRHAPHAYRTGPVRELAGRMRRSGGGAARSVRRTRRGGRGGTLRNGLRSGLGSRTTVDDLSPRVPDSNYPDLFYNYYQAADAGADYSAGMYPSPHPTPPITGQTYYTYQPFLPHEYMYMHSRSYYRMYNFNQGLNRTHVTYKPNSRTSLRQMFHWVFEPVR